MIIPFYLITGFLGSGKTTLIKKILMPQKPETKIAVIQNEFAANSIDGVELQQENKHIRIVEINTGSVFCACLMGHFVETLKSIVRKYQPEIIYLEASGLANPGAISEILNEVELSEQVFLAGSVCVVDAFNFKKALHKMPLVVQQIRMADWLCLNKIDLVTAAEMEEIEGKLEKLNPYAECFTTTYADIDTQFTQKSIYRNKGLMLANNDNGRPENIKSVAIRTVRKISKQDLDRFLKELSEITMRAKGFMNLSANKTILFQSVFGNYSYIEYEDYHANTEFTAIGEHISVKQIKNLFESYTH